jgi:hypothetical protein
MTKQSGRSYDAAQLGFLDEDARWVADAAPDRADVHVAALDERPFVEGYRDRGGG